MCNITARLGTVGSDKFTARRPLFETYMSEILHTFLLQLVKAVPSVQQPGLQVLC